MRKKGTWKLSVTPGKRVLGKSYWQPSLTALHQKLKLKKKVKYHVLVRLFLQLARQVKVDHKVCKQLFTENLDIWKVNQLLLGRIQRHEADDKRFKAKSTQDLQTTVLAGTEVANEGGWREEWEEAWCDEDCGEESEWEE
jgi:hypothetical protein